MRYHKDYQINRDIKDLRTFIKLIKIEIDDICELYLNAIKKNTMRFINAGVTSKTKKVL